MSAAQIIQELSRLSAADRRAVELRLLKMKAVPSASRRDKDRTKWAKELDELAETSRRLSTGKKGPSVVETINDIRGDR